MSDEQSDEFQELESYESYQEISRNNSAVSTAVVPLDTSEDAQFSEQMFSNIQERLSRITKRVSLANLAMAQIKRNLKARIPSTVLVDNADKLAGGDNPQRIDNTAGANEAFNE
ncbi:LOW QUALITY PROTEIN: uncharacterized protein LOC128259929 [Drosophila gunungcola]|uniref:LOW QUALITY PROTEIN: uncharacterized protein LOC128259929 n=1 Tax=Drosophila gunungcola TaxID=103775 RepID=UPI0022E7213C|nr:LOW QUALITY PROTEIN: uncharacterized protein LOC128259929 [Drosophila gunungcola]